MKKNNRGAASILVILIIVVLATFGGIALTAGWTNKQLSIKAAQSKTNYYTLDSVAEETVAEIDNLLYLVDMATKDYLNDLSNKDEISSFEKSEKLEALFLKSNNSLNSVVLKTKKINETYVRNYYYNCAINLERYAEQKGINIKYSNGYDRAIDFLNTNIASPKTGSLLVEFSVSEGDIDTAKSLDIIVAIKAPEINSKIDDAINWRTDFTLSSSDDMKRFAIFSWKLRQKPIEYDSENPKFG